MSPATLEERLLKVRHAIALTNAAVCKLSEDARSEDRDLLGAVMEQLELADNELYWISDLPATLQGFPIPDDDEVGVEARQAYFEDRIRETFSARKGGAK